MDDDVQQQQQQEVEHDPLRDSLLRYMGYANEVGEALRPIVSRLTANGSYGVAGVYVLADAVDKGMKAHTKTAGSAPAVAAEVADALLWQGTASVAIPGLAIHQIVTHSARIPALAASSSPMLVRWAPTALGLAVIPLIIHPIDTGVTWIMDRTLRSWIPHLTPSTSVGGEGIVDGVVSDHDASSSSSDAPSSSDASSPSPSPSDTPSPSDDS